METLFLLDCLNLSHKFILPCFWYVFWKSKFTPQLYSWTRKFLISYSIFDSNGSPTTSKGSSGRRTQYSLHPSFPPASTIVHINWRGEKKKKKKKDNQTWLHCPLMVSQPTWMENQVREGVPALWQRQHRSLSPKVLYVARWKIKILTDGRSQKEPIIFDDWRCLLKKILKINLLWKEILNMSEMTGTQANNQQTWHLEGPHKAKLEIGTAVDETPSLNSRIFLLG